MSRVVISGFYGFHNIGDEAILKALIDHLRKLNPSIQITVLSHNPSETEIAYGVKAVKRHDAWKVFKAIANADFLLSGGGSLLQDDTSARSIHYYLSIIRMGLMMKKKVFLISNGIGPIIREGNKRQVARVLNRVNHITVRDFNSKKLLIHLGVAEDKISVSADMVMAMNRQPDKLGKEILDALNIQDQNRERIGIAIRNKDFKDDQRKKQLIDLAHRLSLKYTVIFVPFYFEDDAKIAKWLKPNVSEHVYFIENKYAADEVMSLMQQFKLLIGSRLHSLIFSLVAEVPFIGISYDPKIENFMEMFSMKPVCAMHDFDVNKISESVDAMETDYETNKTRIIEAKQMLEKQLTVNDLMLKEVI